MHHMRPKPTTLLVALVFLMGWFVSCSKKGGTDGPADPCAGKTINVSVASTDASGGAANGSVTVTASGSSGFTYSINGGVFSANNVFTNLAAGDYTVIAKDNTGCSRTATIKVNSADACAGKTFVFSPAIVNADKCAGDGKVTLTVTGGTGFSYKLNNGNYQSSNDFTNVPAGTHNFFAKDAAGCEKSSSVTVPEKPAGPLFIAVKALLLVRCANCHTNGGSEGGMSFDTDCNVVSAKGRIKVRAVDEGTMPQGGPPLSATEKQRITDWINAGGQHAN